MATATVTLNNYIKQYYKCDIADKAKCTIGESVTIHLECNLYYGTDEIPYMYYTSYGQKYGDNIPFTKVDDTHFILTTSFSDYGDTANRTVTIYAVADKRYCNIDASQLVQCSSTLDGQYTVSDDLTFTVTTDSNYEFPVAPYIYYTVGTKEYTLELEKVNDYTYSKPYNLTAGITYYVIGEAVKKTIISDKYGLITAYHLSKDELKEVASKRWIERTWEPKTWKGAEVLFIANDEYIDTAKYVVSIFKLYMDVESDTKEKLYFGPYDMDMECEVIPTDIVTLDFGSVDIVGKYQNGIDYDNTDIDCYLPFVGFTSLPTKDFMDKTVKLQYQVNVLNGDAIAILSANGNIMLTLNCNIAFSVPFQLSANEYVSTNLETNSNYLENTAPFLYVKSHKAVNPDESLPYKDTKYYAKFGDLSGYTEATEIDFEVKTTHITKTEIDEIIQLLHNGVFL